MQHCSPQTSTSLLLACGIVALACWLEASQSGSVAQATLLDNIHWTLSFSLAAWLAWRSVGVAEPDLVPVRRMLALGLISLAIGQLIWDVQAYLNWTPFPAPSDLFFLPVAPLVLLAFWFRMRQQLSAASRRALMLDIAGFALAASVLTLTLYLPRAGESSPWQLLVLCAYPVLYLTAAVAGLMMQLHLRQRWTWRWAAIWLGLFGFGLTWMLWNLMVLSERIEPGSLVGLSFSLLALLLCWGFTGWRPQSDSSASFDRLCEGVLRQLPLLMVVIGALAVGLLLLGGTVPAVARKPLVGAGLLVLIFAVVRQTQQLGERDRMLAAERVVAESQARLSHMAHHDALTGLPNLMLLRDRVQHEILSAQRHGSKLALMFVDLDHFKEVNDTLGHAAGDALLCEVAVRLQALLRGIDTVCRQGGDEFCVVLAEVEAVPDVVQVAEKMMAALRQPIRVAGQDLALSMSVGVALYPDDAADFASLLRCADTAMYRAKAAGRCAYRFYDARMNVEASERMRVRSQLALALERGELSLHWQPQIELATGHVSGAEALLRWQSAELGSVSPAVFIPLAEDSGLIVDIGRWVLQQACQHLAAWRRTGLALPCVAVNLSVLQFRSGNLEHQVLEALRSAGLSPSDLELEITESVLMVDPDTVISTMRRLADLGVSLAIDDFGTGYSSLSYVRRLRASKLKIDRSFVNEVLDEEGSAPIVRAVIEMASALGWTVIAEGVETEAQRDFLRANRCAEGQGYLFGKPMAAADFEAWLRARSQGPVELR